MQIHGGGCDCAGGDPLTGGAVGETVVTGLGLIDVGGADISWDAG